MEEKRTEIALGAGKDLSLQRKLASSILDRISRDVELQGRNQGLDQPRFRLGEYLLREPDYQQILIWAEALAVTPPDVLELISDPNDSWDLGESHFAVVNGTITSMYWLTSWTDMYELDFSSNLWPNGPQVRNMIVGGGPENTRPAYYAIELPKIGASKLSSIRCHEYTLDIFDLSVAPRLTELYLSGDTRVWNTVYFHEYCHCGKGGSLSGYCDYDIEVQTRYALELIHVPQLTKLECINIDIFSLDLSSVPQLTELNCSNNQLEILDLSPVPDLTKLNCSGSKHYKSRNFLRNLDLSSVPKLVELDCSLNPLKTLDLSLVPKLTKLNCSQIGLTELDLTHVPKLTQLNCSGFYRDVIKNIEISDVSPPPRPWGSFPNRICLQSHLKELDLAAIPMLTKLNCSHNIISAVDLAAVPMLTELNCSHTYISELNLAAVPELSQLDFSYNKCIKLDLSLAPRLTKLHLEGIDSKELDLSPTPLLSELNCSENCISELNLAPVHDLTILDCSANKNIKLNLSNVPNLTKLYIENNDYNELDLTPIPLLIELHCANNRIEKLDLTPVTMLTNLDCSGNLIKKLDLSPVPMLRWLSCSHNTRLLNVPEGISITRESDPSN